MGFSRFSFLLTFLLVRDAVFVAVLVAAIVVEIATRAVAEVLAEVMAEVACLSRTRQSGHRERLESRNFVVARDPRLDEPRLDPAHHQVIERLRIGIGVDGGHAPVGTGCMKGIAQ